MLNEGWRRKERGTDVVVGWVDTHGRPQTEAQLRDLEVLPRKPIVYRGQTFDELDLDGLLARHPELALVDELAHTNVPGSRNAKRWQDVEELLDAGINVISTVNLQHLESLNDVVEGITGVVQRETVPDGVVRSADQIELVDMAPEALQRRLAHGNVYPPDRIDAALGNYFRTGNLTALRELALLWLADRVDEELQDYRERHGIAGPWETKERVVVSLSGAPGGAVLVRRAARMAMRTKAELVGVHIRSEDGLTGSGSDGLIKNRTLLEELGGRYVEVVGRRGGTHAGPGGEGGERHPVGAGRHPSEPADRVRSGLGGQLGDPGLRRFSRRPRHRHRRGPGRTPKLPGTPTPPPPVSGPGGACRLAG